jgi:hypothetical protein
LDVLLIPSLLLLLAALLTLYLRRVLRTEVCPETLPQPKRVLVPAAEQALLIQLEQLLDSSCRIFWNVSLSDLLRIGRGSEWDTPEQQLLLKEREFTSVICDRETFAVLAVIDFCSTIETPAPAANELVPGLNIPVVRVSESDCEQNNLRPLLLSQFPELELRLSHPLAVPPVSQCSVFSSY